MASRTGQIALGAALAASLALHLSAFGLAREIADWRRAIVTESRAAQPETPPADERLPNETEFKPGIDKGAPAMVTWIGYEEYEEHLAQLGETDQAAFTSAISRGTPDSMSTEQAPPPQTPPEQTKAQASGQTPDVAPALPPIEATKIDDPKTGEAAPPAPETAEAPSSTDAKAPATEAAPNVESVTLPVPPAEQTARAPVESKTDEAKPAEATPELPPAEILLRGPEEEEPARVQPERRTDQSMQEQQPQPTPETDPSLLPMSVPTPMPGVAPMPVSAPQGEPVAKDAASSEKDSSATSTKEVAESKWNNGKPLAVKGMELHPYSLQRHILLDSRDFMFSQQLNRGRWEGRVRRNPIVSMRFGRDGRVGEIRLIRLSGFAPLDQTYLTSWIARWKAVDKRLAQLGPGELTSPILMKIVFIDEPEAKAESPR